MSADAWNTMVEVQRPTSWREKAEDHRRMARAAIRLALKRGISDKDIMAEYEAVCVEESCAADRTPE